MIESSENMNELIKQYKEDKPKYEELVKEVKHTLLEKLKDTQIKVVDDEIRGRVKDENSLADKLKRKSELDYPAASLSDIKDLAGVRIVCLYKEEMKDVTQIIKNEFEVLESENKVEGLGSDKMGYQGIHHIVQFKSKLSGPRYDKLIGLKCEIQVRTILEDAWAKISHHLVYKHEDSIHLPIKRKLNNVMSLFEIAQIVFDLLNNEINKYSDEITKKKDDESDFLGLTIDHDTLLKYTQWKYPDLPTSNLWNSRLLQDLDKNKYQILNDIDNIINKAKSAVDVYRLENPDWFNYGTDFITKSLGFLDVDFRKKHPFGQKTKDAFIKHSNLIKGN